MGKKIRYQYLTGSLLQPLLQYVNKVEVSVNPINDPEGTKIGEHYYKFANAQKPGFRGQNFTSSLDYDFTSSSSTLVLHYINGWKQGFHLKNKQIDQMMNQHKIITKFIQLQRNLQNFDDEYEDQQKK